VVNPREATARRLAEVRQALGCAESGMRSLSVFEALMGFADETSRAWDRLYSAAVSLRAERTALEKALAAEVTHAE
jgi:hypothetical protein